MDNSVVIVLVVLAFVFGLSLGYITNESKYVPVDASTYCGTDTQIYDACPGVGCYPLPGGYNGTEGDFCPY